MGFPTERITFSWVSAAEGTKWADLVNEVTDKIKGLGPFEDFSKLDYTLIKRLNDEDITE